MSENFQVFTQYTLILAALVLTIAIGVAVARRYRDNEAEGRSDSSDMMSKFRELHEEGGLSDEEFRTIKTKLARELKAELKSELNDNSNSG